MQSIFQNPLFAPLVITLVIIAVFPLLAGYIVLAERKLLADFQVRLGPMRVGPHGILQPIADAVKLLIKEDVIPTQADQFIFWMAPCVSTFTALTAFAVIPFTPLHSRGGRQRRPAGDQRHVLGRDSRHRAWRMVVEQPLLAAGRAPQRRAVDQLRGGARFRAGVRA